MHARECGLLRGAVLGHCDGCVDFLLFPLPEERIGTGAGRSVGLLGHA